MTGAVKTATFYTITFIPFPLIIIVMMGTIIMVRNLKKKKKKLREVTVFTGEPSEPPEPPASKEAEKAQFRRR